MVLVNLDIQLTIKQVTAVVCKHANYRNMSQLASATWKDVEFEPDLSASVAAGTA